jgi:hypothetical protein
MHDLQARGREGIEQGRLPSTDCLVTWLGAGRGEVCDVCSSRILGSELSVECDMVGGKILCFHAPCYDLWLSTRRR